MSMIYGNAALALLGCFMCVFMVLTFIALLVKAHRAVAAINIPIAIATQGESIRVSLSCRLKEAGFDGAKYRVTVKIIYPAKKVQNGCQEAVIFCTA